MNAGDRHLLAQEVQTAEGLRLKAYQDSLGVWTIGYGTNLQELTIDKGTAIKWLADKLAEAERECERFPWYAGLSPRRQRAVVELVYNLGMPRLMGFTKTLAALSQGEYATAAKELLDSKWAQQVGPTRSHRIAGMIVSG